MGLVFCKERQAGRLSVLPLVVIVHGIASLDEIDKIGVKLGVLGKPQDHQVVNTLDGVSMEVMGAASVEHQGLSTLEEASAASCNLRPTTVLRHAYK